MVLCETQAGHEVRGNGRKRGKGEQGVLGDATKIAKIFWKGGRHRADLVRHLLVRKHNVRRRRTVEMG